MRFVYIDEAGISNPAHEPFLVVAGVIVHGDFALNAVENELERIMQRHIPARLRDGFVFHATEVFNGGKKLRRQPDKSIGPHEWPAERRFKIADEIIAVLKKFSLPVAYGLVDRANFPITLAPPPGWTSEHNVVAQHVSAFMNCAMVAEQWMRKETQNENCLLVVENNDRARTTISDIQRYHQNKEIELLLDEKERIYFPLRKIKENPLFQPKKPSNPLILADFCAYIFKRFLMNDQKYDRFFDPIRPLIITFDDSWLERQRKRASRTPDLSRQRQSCERPL